VEFVLDEAQKAVKVGERAALTQGDIGRGNDRLVRLAIIGGRTEDRGPRYPATWESAKSDLVVADRRAPWL